MSLSRKTNFFIFKKFVNSTVVNFFTVENLFLEIRWQNQSHWNWIPHFFKGYRLQETNKQLVFTELWFCLIRTSIGCTGFFLKLFSTFDLTFYTVYFSKQNHLKLELQIQILKKFIFSRIIRIFFCIKTRIP